MSLTMREKSVIRKEENDNAGSPGKAVRTAIKHDNLIARCIRRPSVSGGATWTTGSPACPNGRGKRKRHDPRMALASRAGVVFSEYN